MKQLMETVVRKTKPQVVMLELDADRLDCLPPGKVQMVRLMFRRIAIVEHICTRNFPLSADPVSLINFVDNVNPVVSPVRCCTGFPRCCCRLEPFVTRSHVHFS